MTDVERANPVDQTDATLFLIHADQTARLRVLQAEASAGISYPGQAEEQRVLTEHILRCETLIASHEGTSASEHLRLLTDTLAAEIRQRCEQREQAKAVAATMARIEGAA